MVSSAEVDQRRAGQDDTDSFTDFLIPIPSQGLPQHLLDEKNAKGYWICIWHNLVGLWHQSYRLFHCISCKYRQHPYSLQAQLTLVFSFCQN